MAKEKIQKFRLVRKRRSTHANALGGASHSANEGVVELAILLALELDLGHVFHPIGVLGLVVAPSAAIRSRIRLPQGSSTASVG